MKLNKIKQELKILSKDLESQKKIYLPTIFWSEACLKFFKLFKKKGLSNFRREYLSTNFFVPLYNFNHENNKNLLLKIAKKNTKKFRYYLENIFSGKLESFSDYKIFLAADKKNKLPRLDLFSESKIGNPIEQFLFEEKNYSRSSLNYLLGLAFLKRNLKNFIPKIFLEIGGGFGTLGEILFYSKIKNFRYINIDIPPMNYVSEYYLLKNFKTKNVESYFNSREKKKIHIQKLKKKINCLCSWQIENLVGKIDVFVNFVSFQEMEPHIVKNYLKHVVRLAPKFILLRNLREGKQLKTSTRQHGVKKQTKNDFYIKILQKKYALLKKNVVPFGEQKFDNFNSELLLFKKK